MSNLKYQLGPPGAMVELFSVNAGTALALSRNEQAQTLINGGTTVLRSRATKRAWQFSRDWLSATEDSILRSLYLASPALAPSLRLIDPNEVNVLPAYASTFGAASGGDNDRGFWTVKGGATMSLPTPGSGGSNLQTVHVAAVGDGLVGNAAPTTPDVLLPWVRSGWIYAVSAYAIATGGPVTIAAGLMSGDGSATGTGQPVTLSSSAWQRITASTAVVGGGPHVLPLFVVTALSAAADITFSFPQVEAVGTVAQASPWLPGLGVAEVVFDTGISLTVPRTGFRSDSWTLREA